MKIWEGEFAIPNTRHWPNCAIASVSFFGIATILRKPLALNRNSTKGGFTILSTIIFRKLKSGDGQTVCQHRVLHAE
jgi:hypothetical protein